MRFLIFESRDTIASQRSRADSISQLVRSRRPGRYKYSCTLSTPPCPKRRQTVAEELKSELGVSVAERGQQLLELISQELSSAVFKMFPGSDDEDDDEDEDQHQHQHNCITNSEKQERSSKGTQTIQILDDYKLQLHYPQADALILIPDMPGARCITMHILFTTTSLRNTTYRPMDIY
ncbi:hypothetical protein BJ138DRAFT_1144696 [Hygrophoropsis aurantiaca]|uniref:Uncharacterized protein n=1 Tax=Hygrophoropsis aurantiaca TaxID=72124 RepID=A0ACB8AL73_9AGAM|nr:hypothetical protein BJ138DRAFT_1144696 [Hygrophoropsis aurantiaca]